MTRMTREAAEELARGALVAVGAHDAHARRVARGLVGSDLAGVTSHGLSQIPRYVAAVRSGELDPTAQPVVVHDGSATARVAGRWAFGHVAADLAVSTVLKKVGTQGVAVVALIECHHIGRMGEFVEDAAAQGVALAIYGGGQGVERPAAVPYGGRSAVLHTNPIAIGAPADPGRPFVMDIATTAMSGLKVAQIAAAHGTLPPDTIVDAEGSPTVDPNQLSQGGAHLPFGRHKGYAFMLTAEVFGRIVTGADDASDTERGGPWLRHAGYLFVGFAVDAFIERERYDERVRDLFDSIRAVPPAPGFDRVLVPGDVEATSRAATADAFDYPDDLVAQIRRLARSPDPGGAP